MVRNLLVRGMIAGLAAGIAAFLFAFVIGEPAVQASIDVEEAGSAQAHSHEGTSAEPLADHSHETEVPRSLQRTAGLITGTTVYGVAVGGIFGLAAAFAYGRTKLSTRGTALVLAAGAFVTLNLVPFLKYPANPPSVGNGDTIGQRTAYYGVMLLISVIASLGATRLFHDLARTRDWGVAALITGAGWLVVIVAAFWSLPVVDEIGDFPADLLWQFRVASLGTQLVLWVTVGIVFAALTSRAERPAARERQPELAGI